MRNKKAYFDYNVELEFVAGMKLLGTEIKSIRDGSMAFNDSYCYIDIKNNKVFLKSFHIKEYKLGTYANHDPLRERELLLNKKEIFKINSFLKIKGYTLVPLEIFITSHGIAKLKIGVCRGKKNYDKKEKIKERDIAKQTSREY